MGLAATARPLALWSASAVHEQRYGEVAHAMTLAEMAELRASYAAAARRNLRAGMDGIEVHCGHGLLLAQFLSPATNRRQDAYGGTLENRARYPAEILQSVREEIGPDVPLGIRISGAELTDDGLSAADVRRIVPLLVRAGTLDYVDVSAGTDGDMVSNMLHESPMGLPDAPFAPFAAGIRAIAGVPVIHGTRIHTPALAERMLREGVADMIGMCRSLIADPQLPRKARAGRLAEIVPCVACVQACLGRLHRGQHISCVGNPRSGREVDWPTAIAPLSGPARRVVVIGGGPAGLEVAATAAERGHSVVLLERAVRLGGALRLAAMLPGRAEWRRLLAQRLRRVRRAGVQIRRGTVADPALVRTLGAEAVVVATGAKPARPPIPGAEQAHVVLAEDVLVGRSLPGLRVVVIDLLNRQSGFATAIMLARSGHAVRLVTAGPFAGWKLESQTYVQFYRDALPLGVVPLAHTVVTAIAADHVTTRHSFTGTTGRLDAVDAVVIAAPAQAEDALAAALRASGFAPHLIGDCYAPRDIEAAILEGHTIGRTL
jgi:2,4-dienoyl-CoA reductase-like NADH-dependent reductase (Old Yellow Enzyme family)/thioredoxin reductase